MFPFAGFIAMLGVIATLVVDSVAFGYYTRSASGDVVDVAEDSGQNERTDVEMDNKQVSDDSSRQAQLLIRHRVASQVLELGILVHSVIIGISLGASESPSTVRPLLAALSFHQFFEGIGLGGCIIQAKFKTKSIVSMVVFFCMTTSVGVIIGIGISSVYNENNVTALIVQGILNSVSAGILVYMALVDLLAADFMSDKVQKNGKLQIGLNFSLLAGVGLMSLLAKWA
ncbi:Zinc transporter 5 [Zostera marina]|uniref:Zinc transporter 5 n=1 Tax=Zostera marina TaxID=29655 RepID=A0A0K9NMK1_ZOSMR|nr:Zinc transporter 5 [Zostera marina]